MPKLYGLPEEAIAKLCSVFSQYPAIQSVLLYGSRAKGNYRPGSDIDLSIQAPALGLSDLLAIENQIDDLLLPWTVDLSLLHHIDNPELIDHIRRVGTPLYSPDARPRRVSRPGCDQPTKIMVK
jgi:predicted nucleotidyltransferase